MPIGLNSSRFPKIINFNFWETSCERGLVNTEEEEMEELKKKIAEAMSCEFVGDCRFDDEELSKMYSYSEE